MKGMNIISRNSETLVHLVLIIILLLWRSSGFMVSVPESGLSGLGSSPGLGHSVVFLAKTRYSVSQCLSPPRYINECDGLVSHPGESRNTPSRLMLLKPE